MLLNKIAICKHYVEFADKFIPIKNTSSADASATPANTSTSTNGIWCAICPNHRIRIWIWRRLVGGVDDLMKTYTHPSIYIQNQIS